MKKRKNVLYITDPTVLTHRRPVYQGGDPEKPENWIGSKKNNPGHDDRDKAEADH